MVKTRYDFRIKKRVMERDLTIFFMFALTQTLEDISSLLRDGRHIVMWDLEVALEQAEDVLRKIQRRYNLSHIFIVSDIEGSYRGWCFSKVSFKILLSILVDSLDIIDYSFFYYTVKRRKETLRTDRKKGRPPQQLVSVLESYPSAIPTKLEQVIYDTGLEKRGRNIMLGDRDG